MPVTARDVATYGKESDLETSLIFLFPSAEMEITLSFAPRFHVQVVFLVLLTARARKLTFEASCFTRNGAHQRSRHPRIPLVRHQTCRPVLG